MAGKAYAGTPLRFVNEFGRENAQFRQWPSSARDCEYTLDTDFGPLFLSQPVGGRFMRGDGGAAS
jgi:hypothetical protein